MLTSTTDPDGFLDFAGTAGLAGWAWDPARPEFPVLVEIWVGEKLLGEVAADQFREDLRTAGKGHGRHGFTFPLPNGLAFGGVVTFRAKIAGSGRELAGSPRVVFFSEPSAGSTLYAEPQPVGSPANCYFYHTMEIPGVGLVEGEWDLRANTAAYLGGQDLRGKRVLEIGKASGFLSFFMERQGAEVVAYDLSERETWDTIPYAGYDYRGRRETFRTHIKRMNDGFWLAHKALDSKVKLAHGTVYSVPRELGEFDAAVLASVLLHVRDPFHALENALRLTRDLAILVEAVPPPMTRFLKTDSPHFMPDAATQEPKDTWWFLPPPLLTRFLEVLGFTVQAITRHEQNFQGVPVPHFTIVARRTAGQPDL